ncbi:hypothetical protein HBH64_046680 [Parastagonospora nodorum]|nr:hypothetical protein HBI02_153840 [Parastagonospora nodorum]KAH4300938.1 hypothetical protein HBI01_102380 [Parastagonospora nodorum]KAH4365828.1 hypothetical protein HBH94_155910 [Parastagonospora nodorum]KAH4464808.1 hypothetical protein HBH90_103340 [Parastagonospora nodorum]KAH4481924.1 hypothetical protein HBH89_244470 [Parastagonospora nodorum]
MELPPPSISPAPNPVLQRVAQQSFSVSPSPGNTPVAWSVSPSPAPRARSSMPGGTVRLTWDNEMEEALVKALVSEVERGHRTDSGYKKEAWEAAREAVQRVASPRQSGFGVDENGVVTAAPEALEAYFEAHKEARKFKLRPIKYEASLRLLFEGVLATGQDAMDINDLAKESFERDPSAVPDERQAPSQRESFLVVTPRKRSATSCTPSSVRSTKRGVTDCIGRELGELAEHFEAFVSATEKDYQRDALKTFLKQYDVLQPTLRLAIVEAFEKEYTAKLFCLMKPPMRRKWVQKELLRRRDDIVSAGFAEDEFDRVMESVQWDGDGVLTLRGGRGR